MGIPLKRLLNVGGLRNCKVVAGQRGINKVVKNVTIMEVPDIIRWLKGNELLMTSLYPIKDDLNEQIQLIEKLHSVGATAIAIKPTRFVKCIPEEMKRQADKYAIAIIEIPEEITYLDILSPVMNAIFNNKVILQEDLEQATTVLTEISISKGCFNYFIQTLSYLTKSKVFLESLVPYITITNQEEYLLPMDSQQYKELEIVQRPLRMLRHNVNNEAESCIVAPIMIDGKLYGTITCWSYNMEFMEVDLAIQEKAATLLSVEFLKKKIEYEIELQYKNDFIRDLLFNQEISKTDLLERGEFYKFNDSEVYLCINISSKGILADDLFKRNINQLEGLIKIVDPNIIVGTIRNILLLMVPTRNLVVTDIKKRIQQLQFSIEQVIQVGIRMGVGTQYSGVRGIRDSYREAEKALSLGAKLWKDKTINYFTNLGVFRLISANENNIEFRNYYDEAMRDLIIYDQGSASDLINTLEFYFSCNESIKETANQLFIHVNTLKYRLKKIQEITKLDISKSDDKFMLYMGLKIHQYFSLIVGKDDKNVNILSL